MNMTNSHGPQHIQFIATNVPPALSPQVANYAIALLNQAFILGTQKPLRKIVYETLASNGFNNATLNTAVELAFRIGWYGVYVNRSKASLDHAMPEAVLAALGYITAELAISNPSITAGIPHMEVEQIRATAARYRSERSTYMAITFNEANVQTTGMLGGGISIPDTAVMHSVVTTPMSPDAGSPDDDNWMTLPSSGPALNQANVIQQTASSSAQKEADQAIDATTAQEVKAPEPEVRKYLYEPARQQLIEYPKHITTIGGKHEMDAMKHARAYFGNMEISAQHALTNLKGASFKMAQDAQADVVREVPLTSEEIHMAMTTQDLLDHTRLQHRAISRKTGKPEAIVRVLGVVLNPAPATREVADYLPQMFSQDIRNVSSRFKAMVNCQNLDRPTLKEHERLMAVNLIDRTLGRYLNDFLARGLRIPARTSTFADAITACRDHVSTKFGTDYTVLLENFLSVLGENLQKYSTPEIQQGVALNLGYHEDDGVLVVPTAQTVTYVNLTSQELDWTTSFKGTDIDPKVTPTLDEICFTLKEDKARYGFKSSYDWLVTGDGESYLLYENPDLRGGYRLFPVSGLNINRLV